MITVNQIIMARAVLGWSQSDLAEASGLATTSISRIECNIVDVRLSTLMKIRNCLEEKGIVFIQDQGKYGVLL